MKKLISIGLSCFIALNAIYAQQTGNQKFVQSPTVKKAEIMKLDESKNANMYVTGVTASKVVTINKKKFRATPFVTDDMGSGTSTTLPTGWSTTATFGWNHRTTAYTSGFSIGTIASTTASNGWLGYNSDSIGAVNGLSTFTGWVQKTFNCTGHSSVALLFQTNFVKFQDSCVVKVSTNGGTSWTTYPISETNSLANNAGTADPANILINITGAAANQAAVIVRFENTCWSAGGAYNWLIDDLGLAELDPIDTKLDKAGFSQFTATNDDFQFRSLPLSQMDSIFPFVFYSNVGANSTTNVTADIKIYKAAANVGNTTAVQPSLPTGAIDSGRYANAGYLPTGISPYTISYNLNQAGDANVNNNMDTVRFDITDSLYGLNDGFIEGSYILFAKPSGSTPSRAFGIGNMFTVAVEDTINGALVAYTTSTEPGAKVKAGIYKFDATASAWSFVMGSNVNTLTAANISTTGNIVWSRIAFPYTDLGGGLLNILTPGQYAVIVEAHEGVATNKTANIYASGDLNVINTFGAADTNGGDFAFGANGLPFGLTSTPLVAALFGHSNLEFPTSVTDIANSNFAISASPNPSNGIVTFAINSKVDAANALLTVTSVTGQILRTVELGKIRANNEVKTTLDLSDLPTGNYFYVIQAGKDLISNKFTVK
jgi:hypothetical protein